MRFWWSIVALWIVVATVACGGGGGDSDDEASGAAKQVFEQFLARDYGGAWDSLHPAHQALVARDTYINCQAGASVPWTSVEVISEHTEFWPAPELGQVSAQAVELRLIGDQDITSGTLHLLKVDGKWRWLLDEEAATAFKQGQCQ